jgi:uncharacterized protein YccT (UPF0319 family)
VRLFSLREQEKEDRAYMNLLKSVIFSFGLVGVLGGVQAATLTSDRSVEFMVVNGKEVEFERWSPQQSIELDAGTHQVVMRFEGEVKRGNKEVVYTSRPYIFDIKVDSRNMTVGLDSRLSSQSQAASYFASGAKWQIEYENGEVTPIASTELEGDGFAAYADMEALVAQYNRANGIIIDQGETKNLNDVLVEVDNQGQVSIKGDAVTQLKLWFSKASDEERKAFRRWMIDQE